MNIREKKIFIKKVFLPCEESERGVSAAGSAQLNFRFNQRTRNLQDGPGDVSSTTAHPRTLGEYLFWGGNIGYSYSLMEPEIKQNFYMGQCSISI